jgi:hypothetical protein
MTTQATFWTGAGASLAVALVAGLLDWRRNRRRDLDSVGWMPWRGIQAAAFFAALAFAAIALHA